MPFFIENSNNKLSGKPLPRVKFDQAKKDFEERIKTSSGKFGVNLSKDVRVSYFSTAAIDKILKSGKELIVARFGCENGESYFSTLNAVLCSMDKFMANECDNIYIGTNNPGDADTPVIDDNIELWKKKEGNYTTRRDKLVRGNRTEFKDEMTNGIAHTITEFTKEWYAEAVKNGMKNVAIYFIKFPKHTTVAYVDANISLEILLAQYIIYDQGTGCCPVK